MLITLNSKVRLYPDEISRNILLETMRLYRDACNYVSSFVFYTQSLEWKAMHNNLYYDLRKFFGLKSQMALSVLRTVRTTYKARDARSNEWSLIRFNKPQLDLLWNRDYSFSKGLLSINTINGRIKVPFDHKRLSHTGTFGTAKLIYKHNKFYFQIPISKEVEDTTISDTSCIVGIDRGIRFLVTAYDSSGKTTFFSGAEYKHKRSHYYELKRQLRLVGTNSSKRRLKSIIQRENRWVNDLNHCISKALVESYPKGTLFVLENLNRIQSTHSKCNGKDNYIFTTWPYYDLEIKLMYKAAMKGQMVIKVDPAFTSQTCPLCGRKNQRSRIRNKHIFRCVYCRYKSNDDRVAAINLYSKGIKYLVQSRESIPLFGGAQSNVPDAKAI